MKKKVEQSKKHPTEKFHFYSQDLHFIYENTMAAKLMKAAMDKSYCKFKHTVHC